MPMTIPTIYGTSENQWTELNDSAYFSWFGKNDDYNKCKVNLHYENTNENVTMNLPVYPEEVTNSITTNYASYDILGRPGSISAYNNTGDITTQFSLHMHRELKTPGGMTIQSLYQTDDKPYEIDLASFNKIDKIVSLIEAGQYPYLNSIGSASYAPIMTYKFGDTLIVGKQTSCNTKWSGPKIEGKYMDVTINISITNVPKQILDYKDIINSSPRGWGRWQGFASSNDPIIFNK